MTCDHLQFESACLVNRLTDEEGGPPTGYTIDVLVRCADCGEPFTFLGPVGVSTSEPRVSADGLELRAPITPRAARAALLDQVVDVLQGAPPDA